MSLIIKEQRPEKYIVTHQISANSYRTALKDALRSSPKKVTKETAKLLIKEALRTATTNPKLLTDSLWNQQTSQIYTLQADASYWLACHALFGSLYYEKEAHLNELKREAAKTRKETGIRLNIPTPRLEVPIATVIAERALKRHNAAVLARTGMLILDLIYPPFDCHKPLPWDQEAV